MVFCEKWIHRIAGLTLVSILAACAASRPAPVSESRPISLPGTSVVTDPQSMPGSQTEARPIDTEKTYAIQKGDTLISIALQNGLDYRELAAWNNIENPNVIKLGLVLRLTAPGSPVIVAGAAAQPKPGEPVASPLILTPMPTTGVPVGNTDQFKTEPKASKVPYSDAAYGKLSAEAPNATPGSGNTGGASIGGAATPIVPTVSAPIATPTLPAAVTPGPAGSDEVNWAWPIQPQPKGKIIANFTEANKGIDISGAKNTPVHASAPGKVVYSAAGLRGYGRLVIIKHNATWLSAYAHNEKILVMEGQEVKKGQVIAEMGASDTDQVKLHFEIRKQGKPVDPLKFLPN